MMDLKEVSSIRITIKPSGNVRKSDVSRMIDELLQDGVYTATERGYIAYCIFKGQGWEPEPTLLRPDALNWLIGNRQFSFSINGEPVVQSVEESPNVEKSLLERACAGDAEAAIEYCRRVKDGRISFEPSEGSAY